MKRTLAIALLASLFTAATQAAVMITFEVRAVQNGLTGNSSPDAIISPDGSHVSLYDGQVVLQLFAFINSLDGDLTDDRLTRADGSFVTVGTTGDLTGFLRGSPTTTAGINNVDPFRGTGAKSGTQAELSGTVAGNTNDGISDVGGTSTTNFISYFTTVSNSPNGTVGQSFLIGETILDITGGSGNTTVRYVPRIGVFPPLAGNRGNIVFTRDGTLYRMNGDGTPAVTGDPPFDPDALQLRYVTIDVVPEPSTFGLLAPGLLALAGLRRRRA